MQASPVWPCRSLPCGHAGLNCVAMQVSPVLPRRSLRCGQAGPSTHPPIPHPNADQLKQDQPIPVTPITMQSCTETPQSLTYHCTVKGVHTRPDQQSQGGKRPRANTKPKPRKKHACVPPRLPTPRRRTPSALLRDTTSISTGASSNLHPLWALPRALKMPGWPTPHAVLLRIGMSQGDR